MTATEGRAAPVLWRDRTVTVQGHRWSCREAGDGETVILLDPPGLGGCGGGPLEQLTEGHRLIETACLPDDDAVDDPSPRAAARLVGRLAQAMDCDRFAVVSRAGAARVALWLAIENPAIVTRLVLESPPVLGEDSASGDGSDAELRQAMASLEVSTLVLLGEKVEPGRLEALGTYKRLLPASTVGLVYGAGEDVRGDRPSAYTSAVADYLERGQAFLVSHRSTVIHA